jgi:hypothetical protein
MRRTTLAIAVLVTLAGLAAPASAGKKPITKTYTATAAAPDPTNSAPGGTTVCGQRVPGSFDSKPFTAPAPGKLVVDLSDIEGDWDLLLTDASGSEVSGSGSGGYGTPAAPSSERVSVKVKKAKATYNIIACNWAGGPTATVKYVFTYA